MVKIFYNLLKEMNTKAQTRPISWGCLFWGAVAVTQAYGNSQARDPTPATAVTRATEVEGRIF